MKRFAQLAFTAVSLSVIATTSLAGPTCTDEPESKWQDPVKFQDQLKEQGYKIKKFKQTDGNCYEIYGWNDKGQRVEIYFNPVDGSAVKSEIED